VAVGDGVGEAVRVGQRCFRGMRLDCHADGHFRVPVEREEGFPKTDLVRWSSNRPRTPYDSPVYK
jgi:hypothetical protein